MKYALLFLIGLLSAAPAIADPIPCTSTPSAAVSHFVTHNNEYGGHVNAHVLGQTPPNGYSQFNRTLFASDVIYEQAWTALENDDPPLYCVESPQIGAEAARSIQLDLNSRQCTNANIAGVCTASNAVVTRYVRFTFRAVPKGQGSQGAKWILYTAYPAATP
ncbi:hypothetical protein [Sphingomonas sp.]|uniref:hypothetical protein n=1 Tax=Sphingomonas sp. TaxID=28214 RepID=UPI003B3B9F75